MKKYYTQMEAAKKNIVTDEMIKVSQDEGVSLDFLTEKMAKGEIVIPKNINHTSLKPRGIGTSLKTKINVNLGISFDCPNYETEMKKVKLAQDYGADAIMDLSNYGKTHDFRQKLIDSSNAIIGTVPIYDAVGYLEKDLKNITPDDFLNVVLQHAKEGVDFVTIHAGLNRKTVDSFKKSGRLMNIVSRGGSLLYAWMEMNNAENPFFEYYDKLLDILHEYDVTISLGDAMRPGCNFDSTDASQISELIELSLLTKRAWESDVSVLIEGPGHMLLDEIKSNVLLEKKLCHNAPFYVLGPLVTDIAPGYDHITAAIGGAVAASCGVDFLCYVTPAEHLRLPDDKDVYEGIMASKIAAHAGDLVKNVKGAKEWDERMSKARRNLDWDSIFKEAIDEKKAREYFNSRKPSKKDSCSMCGKMCAVRNMNKIIDGENVKLKD